MTTRKRTIEVDDATAAALESRAAQAGLSVAELLAEMVARSGAAEELSPDETAELDRQWSRIKAGEAAIAHECVGSIHGERRALGLGTLGEARMQIPTSSAR